MTVTLIILVITVAMFIWGRVRADIVALTALAALLVLGILTPAEALAGFSSPIVIMMIGLFVVGGAIMQTGLAKLTGNKLMALSRGNETITFLLVMLVTSFIGAFVSNTGTVALMMPSPAGERQMLPRQLNNTVCLPFFVILLIFMILIFSFGFESC